MRDFAPSKKIEMNKGLKKSSPPTKQALKKNRKNEEYKKRIKQNLVFMIVICGNTFI